MLELVGAGLLIGLIGLSIGLHELGHLLPAKAFGVKVTEFAIGFGPALWRGVWGETQLRLRLLPVGGFIRMIGMYAPSRLDGRRVGGWFADNVLDARAASAAEIGEGEDSRTFYRLSTPKRLVVMVGGPAMNLLLATLLFTVCLSGIGLQKPTTQVGEAIACLPTSTGQAANPGDCTATPAKLAGLQPGDRIASLNGQSIKSWVEFSNQLAKRSPGDSVTVGVVRSNGEAATLQAVLADYAYEELDAAGQPTGVTLHRAFLGVSPAYTWEPMPVAEVPGVMWRMTTDSVVALGQFPSRLADLANRLLHGQPRDPTGPISVVGVTRLGGEIAGSDLSLRSKAFDILGLAASLNLFLFLFNLLPLLPLDGGHAAGALFEAARRRWAAWQRRPDPGPIDIARALPLTYAMSVLLIGAGVLVIIADIVAPISLGS